MLGGGCVHGAGRLVSGNTSMEGRAEVCINGQWGTICDDEWTDDSANVMCGQVGHASVGKELYVNLLLQMLHIVSTKLFKINYYLLM